MNFIKRNTFQKPILTGIILMLIALVFRLIDIFVLRLDERLGEIILSKALGFFLVLLFVWAIDQKPGSIGFHGRRLGEGLLIGVMVSDSGFQTRSAHSSRTSISSPLYPSASMVRTRRR